MVTRRKKKYKLIGFWFGNVVVVALVVGSDMRVMMMREANGMSEMREGKFCLQYRSFY